MPIIRDIIYGAVNHGARLKDLCGAIGIAAEELNDSDVRFPFHRACQSWEHAIRLTGDPLLGLHIGESSTPSIMGMAGMLMQSSRDLLTAFEQITEYSSVATDMFQYGIRTLRNEIVLTYQPAGAWSKTSPTSARHAVEQAMSGTLHVFYLLSGQNVLPQSTSFKHRRAGILAEYERVFRSGIRFGDRANQLVFQKKDLLTPVVSYDKSLFRTFEKILREKKQSRVRTVAEQVRRVSLTDFQGQIPSLELVSARLNMTPRTLQRRLAAEGENFRSVIERIQKQLSSELMSLPGTTATAVSRLLGYSDPSAFRRARRNWS